MKDHGTVYSTVKPEELVIDAYHVWKASDIKEVTETDAETGAERLSYSYTLIEYSKDEYIMSQTEQTAALADQLTDTELALCELYESALGE